MSGSNESINQFESPAFDGSSNDVLQELKIRARLRLNALHAGEQSVLRYAHVLAKRRRWLAPTAFADWKLQHALNIVASENGFRDWDRARVVLSGAAKPDDDVGRFWHSYGCEALVNHWFATYAEAKACQQKNAGRWLFPFGKQFVVGDINYVKALLLDPVLSLWEQIDCDLHACYGSAAWHRLCTLRLHATRGLPPPVSRSF